MTITNILGKGEVIKISPESNTLLVLAEDNQVYTFTSQMWRSFTAPTLGTLVVFNNSENDTWVKISSENKSVTQPNSTLSISQNVEVASNIGSYSYGIFATYKNGFKKTFDYKSRSCRKEFWYFMLASTIIGVILSIIFGVIFGIISYMARSPDVFSILFGGGMIIFSLIHFLPSISLYIRRLHDINQTGWLSILYFIPYIGAVAVLVIGLIDTHPTVNQWGETNK